MKYLSTRGGMPPKSFTEILLGGLATDGGLTIPDAYPKLSRDELPAMRGMSYRDLAFEVIRRLVVTRDRPRLSHSQNPTFCSFNEKW